MYTKPKIVMFGGIPILYRKNNVNNTTDVVFGITTGAFGEHHQGVAHFYEHMMFKQTETKDLAELGNLISNNVPGIGATTGFNRMLIYSDFSTRKIESYIPVMADMFFHSKNEQSDMDKECEVICQEVNRILNDAKKQTFLKLWSLASGEKRHSVSPAGLEKDVRTIKSADLFRFRKENFCKENFVFSIFTNKSLGYVKKLVSKYILPNLESNKNLKLVKDDDCLFENKNGIEIIQKKDITKNLVKIGFNGFSYFNELYEIVFDYYIWKTLSKMKGRLWNRMREEESLVYATPNCFVDDAKRGGVLTFSFETTKQNIKRCIEIWAEVADDLRKNGITKEEYDFCKAEMLLDKDFEYERPTGKAQGMFLTYYAFHKFFKRHEYLNKALKLDYETVKNVTKEIFNLKRVWLTSFGDAGKTDIQTIKQLEKMFIKE